MAHDSGCLLWSIGDRGVLARKIEVRPVYKCRLILGSAPLRVRSDRLGALPRIVAKRRSDKIAVFIATCNGAYGLVVLASASARVDALRGEISVRPLQDVGGKAAGWRQELSDGVTVPGNAHPRNDRRTDPSQPRESAVSVGDAVRGRGHGADGRTLTKQ